MPAGDGTGPCGQGALTGRGLGTCKEVLSQPTSNMGLGRGRALGRRGCGRGRGGNRPQRLRGFGIRKLDE